MVGNKQVMFKVTEEKLLEIGQLAEKKGQTIAGLVRQWIYEKLNEEKPAQVNA